MAPVERSVPIPIQRAQAIAGTSLAQAGGLPPVRQLDAAKKPKLLEGPNIENISPALAGILRPQAAYRWLLPYLSAITPQYIESVLRGALAGNHVQAWELFDLMIDTDPEISSCVQEYTEGILSKKILFDPYHEEDEEPSDAAVEKCRLVSNALRAMRPEMVNDENDLRNTVKDLMAARFHGQSLLEIDWHTPDGQLNIKQVPELGNVLCPRSTFWVHPVCYAWDMNGRLGLRVALNDMLANSKYAQGSKLGKVQSMVEPPAWNWITSQPRPSQLIDIPENKFLISIQKAKTGTALSGSCLRPLAWWWVASNFCGDWLLNYAQLFGIPFRKATYGANASETVKAEIKQMLQSCGSAGYIMLPDGSNVEFESMAGGGSDSPQAFLFHFADSQKRKVILHQTMTGGSHDSMGKGGGKAFGEVEDDTKSQCINAGAKAAEAIINLQFIPMLLTLNYGEGGDLEAPTCKLVDVEVGGLADAQRDQVLVQVMDVPESYLNRKYQIPKPKAGEPIAGKDSGVLGAQAEAQAQAQKIQADTAKAMAKQQQNNQDNATEEGAGGEGGDGESGDQGNDDEPKDKSTGTQAKSSTARRKEIRAAAASAALETASKALHETVEPMLARLQAIETVTHKATRIKMLKKFLKDHKELTAAMVHDDSLSKAITPELVQQFVKGLKAKAIEAADAEGHWVTIHGSPILIKDGQSVSEAVKEKFGTPQVSDETKQLRKEADETHNKAYEAEWKDKKSHAEIAKLHQEASEKYKAAAESAKETGAHPVAKILRHYAKSHKEDAKYHASLKD